MDKKYDFFKCIFEEELLPTDAEEMKPMRDGVDRAYNATEEGEPVVAQVQVILVLTIVTTMMCGILILYNGYKNLLICYRNNIH